MSYQFKFSPELEAYIVKFAKEYLKNPQVKMAFQEMLEGVQREVIEFTLAKAYEQQAESRKREDKTAAQNLKVLMS